MSTETNETALTEKVVQKEEPLKAQKTSSNKFTESYVKELREESQRYRNEKQEIEAQLEKFKKDGFSELKKETTDAINALQVQANERIRQSELKAVATKHNLKSLDYLKLADLTSVQVNADGEVIGAEEAIMSLKQSKPELFSEISTSAGGITPQALPVAGIDHSTYATKVDKMNRDELTNDIQQFLASLKTNRL